MLTEKQWTALQIANAIKRMATLNDAVPEENQPDKSPGLWFAYSFIIDKYDLWAEVFHVDKN